MSSGAPPPQGLLKPVPPAAKHAPKARSPLDLVNRATQQQREGGGQADALMARLYSGSRPEARKAPQEKEEDKASETDGQLIPAPPSGPPVQAPGRVLPQPPNAPAGDKDKAFRRRNDKALPLTATTDVGALEKTLKGGAATLAPELPEDATAPEIAQLCKSGALGPKFVYMVPKPRGPKDPHNPYDLRVVKHAGLDLQSGQTEYLTLSSSGITHYQNNEGDYVPLDAWVNECKKFHTLLDIPFFARYRKWKTFYTWWKHVRKNIVASCKTFLSENLFILNQDLSAPLINIRRTCFDIASIPLYDAASETSSLTDHAKRQQKRREEAASRLNSITGSIRGMLNEACSRCMVRSSPRAVDELARLEGEGRDAEPGQLLQPERQTYIEQSQQRAVCRRLTAYIRLCDYMVVDFLVVLADKSLGRLSDAVAYPKRVEPVPAGLAIAPPQGGDAAWAQQGTGAEPPPPEPDPSIYNLDVIFEDTITITPPLEDFLLENDRIVKGFLDTVTAVPRFIKHSQFKKYIRFSGSEQGIDEPGSGPETRKMVEKGGVYGKETDAIKQSYRAAFAELDQYAGTYRLYQDMFHENSALDRDKIKREDYNLDWFRDEMQRYKTESEDIEKIPSMTSIAFCDVKLEKLRSKLEPSPRNCLKILQDLLPELAREKNAVLLEKLRAATGKLADVPATVEAFVDFDKFHTECVDNIEVHRTAFENIKDMYREMDICEPRIEYSKHDNMVFCEGTRPEFDKLLALMQSVEEGKEAMKREFAASVDTELSSLGAVVDNIRTRANDPIVEDEAQEMDHVIEYVTTLMGEIDALKKRERDLITYQEGFQISDPTPVPEIAEVHRDISDKMRLWTSLKEWQELTAAWKETVFGQLNATILEQEVQKYDKTVKQVDRTLKGSPVVPKLRSMVEAFRLTMPVITCLKNPDLKEHHWQQIDELLGQDLSKDPNSWTLGVLIDLNAMDLRDEISTISYQATQEQQLNEMLNGVIQTWVGVEFVVNAYKDQKDAYVLGGVDDVMEQMDESMIVISTIATNRYCSGALRQRVDRWETDMRYMRECLDRWLEVQRKWMYLESIFSNGELQRQWQDDARAFGTVDKVFREIMKRAHDNPNVKTSLLANNSTLLSQFRKDIEQLERIEKRLEEKLEMKRRLFPRFYFLSNDDLLDILAQIKNPERIAPHTLKMFDGVKFFTITESADLTHMNSMEGEVIPVTKPLKARGPVEKWLLEAEGVMILTLRKLAKICVDDYEARDRSDWMFEHPCQLVLTVSLVYWQKTAHEALSSDNAPAELLAFKEMCYTQLRELASATARDLNKVERRILATLILLDVHGRDLVNEMVNDGVSRVTDFGWKKQLRCYWEQDAEGQGDIFIRQNNSQFTYGYEYLGAQGRLVITPLTDRIFMTITGALHLCLGASPSGPAGTGKTESVKDLAKGLGRWCIVYNCSDGVTFKIMEMFFSGLCQTGAWCCLDEFNRINIEVLSVVAQQLMEVREALLAQRANPNMKSFSFQGTQNVDLKPTFGCFITMNPGYAGRTELPDNLKALFRPVACMTPDFRMIAEVIFYSEGFGDAENLSLKITQLYKLSSEQLSPQKHYDFGMRALKSILVMAGDLKRAQPGTKEDLTLIIACNDANIPKFVSDDIPLFKGIMSDLFPGVSIPSREYNELLPAIERDCEGKTLQTVPKWVTKILQFYETLIVRHGVMMVGAAGGGKTEARNVLANALTAMREAGSKNPMAEKVHQYVLNPKSITMGELYGSVDLGTLEWQDGILPIVVKENRTTADAGGKDHEWIVFDGPVDTLWVESMNSVLDDSKLLCLDNGVRMKLPDTVHMLFEVMDLAVASPATVSRCGMVFNDEQQLGWSPVIYRWANSKMKEFLGPRGRAYLTNLIEAKVQLGLEFLRQNRGQLIPNSDCQVAESLCELFYAICVTQGVKFPEEVLEVENDADDPLVPNRNEIIHVIFAFSYVWAVGGNLDANAQELFDIAVRSILEDVSPFSGPNSVYDAQIDFHTKKMISWTTSVPNFDYDPSCPYFDIMVPTVDTVRYSFLLRTLLATGRPVLFNGLTGTGKSAIVQQTLQRCKGDLGLVNVIIQFSAKTSSLRTQDMIESKLKAKRKNILGAPILEGVQQRVALFVDDLNMPALETFGASPPVELVRQMMGNGGFYDRKALFFKKVEDVVVISACGPAEGGRSPVTQRLVRMFNLLQIPNLSDESMKKIFGAILGAFFSSQSFNKDVKASLKNIVDGSIDVFNQIKEKLRPRPVTAHYTFNLRDLSKVFCGIMQATPRTLTTTQSVARLFIHENQRCFYDRLIDASDRRVFTEDIMIPAVSVQFPSGRWDHDDLFVNNPIIWGDFLVMGIPEEERKYEEVPDVGKLPHLFENYLDEWNIATNKNLSLVFFEDHCRHLARIVRIIRQPRGNALLVGVGGSGKQTLTRLAASIVECQLFQIEVDSKYSMDSFHEDLLALYQIAGVDQKNVVFLLNDSQLKDEGMTEDINNMLNSGEVPSLFPPEEKDKKINACSQAAQAAGRAGGRDEVFAYFISKVRDNLRCVLCMSPVGSAFRTRCRNFPSLTNCCAIDWFDNWPDDALRQVAIRQLAECDLGEGSHAAEMKGKTLPDMCVTIHSSVSKMAERFYTEINRHYYVTPTSYLEFISVYLTLLEDKRNEVGSQLAKVSNGKSKMNDTTTFIQKMQKEITEMKPILEVKSVENAEMMKEIDVRKAKASEVRAAVSVQEAEASEKAQAAQAIEMSAKADLDLAMPALNDAVKALDQIEKKDIVEMKAYANPPIAVEKTIQAVMILLKKFKYDWKLAKEVLSDPNLIQNLKTYDRDNIEESVIKKVAKFVVDDPEFTPDKIGAQGSAACKSLCKWCYAMHDYYYVSREVVPKQKKLAAAREELEETNKKLEKAAAALKEVEDEMTRLQEQFDESVRNKEELEFKLDQAQRHLATASVLTDSLGAEVVRWEQMIEQFNLDMTALPADVFLASASIAYFGAFTPAFRTELVDSWVEEADRLGLPISKNYSLMRTLGDPMQIREWQLNSLPTDNTSTENAILVQLGTDEAMKLRRWPLMIDPQGQAGKWIRKMEGKNGLKVIKLSDPKYGQTLKSAIQGGIPVLIDDVGETLDPALESVLLKQVYSPPSGGNQYYINFGSADNAITYEPSFRLYMTTKKANPHYLPEVCIKVTLINFTVTMMGLEDQMLGDVVSIEKSHLEAEKNKIVKSVADDKRKLKRYEDLILSELEDAGDGNILDNQKLIDTLKHSQSTSVMLSKRLVEAEEKAKSIDEARELYRSVANRAATLYFVLADLPGIDPMYQYSLEYFKKLVTLVISGAEQLPNFDEHLKGLIVVITEATYLAVCRGLFNRHKTILSLLICAAIQRGNGGISAVEWMFFNRASALVRADQPEKPAACSFVTAQVWGLLDALERHVPAFQGLLKDVSLRVAVWAKWFGLREPQDAPLPNGESGGTDWEGTLTAFQKLLLLRVTREEKMLFALTSFVATEMGEMYVTAPPVDLKRAHADSAAATPIIFILSQGSDPTDGFIKWAAETQKRNVKSISLGQGQEKPAKQLIETGKKTGDWVLLQNCHLGKSFMPALTDIVAALENDKTVKEDFRLWLTSSPASYFPVPVLQNSIKLTNEAPSGLKANMLRCYAGIKAEELAVFDGNTELKEFSECTRGHAFKKLMFGACFFHSLILERKKFGPLGWNVNYEWNETDISTSTKWLKLFIEENDEIPWESMTYIIGEINYGGRVTDPIDRRTLLSILNKFFVVDIMNDEYVFSESGVYRAPADGTLEFYKQRIEDMPRLDEPEVFGMHENASLRYQLQESQELLRTILLVQPRVTGSGGGVSPEDIVKAKAQEILANVPETLSLDEAGPTSLTYMDNGLPNSISTVLRHEVDKFIGLQTVIQQSMVELGKALAGLTVLSEAYDQLYQDFLSDTVPAMWAAHSYPSLKPLGSWTKDLVDRINFIREWLRNGAPTCFWLAGLFSPHGFMTGTLQALARQFTVSVDLLSFSFKFIDTPRESISKPPTSGVYVYGLFSDSWRWNINLRLMEDSRPGEVYTSLPVIHFLPEENHVAASNVYCAPLYITTARKGNITSLGASSNFIVMIETPTDRAPDYWIQKGAAVVCQLND